MHNTLESIMIFQEHGHMNKVYKIGRGIQVFSPAELAAFRKWFREFDAAAWDRQIEEDIQAGKLDAAARSAIKSFALGRKEL